jgi:phospholipid transport system transporter-binding protein
MPTQPIILSQDRILISGELTFATVGSLLESSHLLFPQQGPWNCDFSQVTHCDSAALALVLEWLKMARQRNIKLRFSQLPQQLLSIAVPAGLGALIEASSAA